ncbi:hypothetical protein CDV55_108767 [Aspergillus turcosus]|uniref:Uncharacterized protein n=1 Tax=Aspergillus turcosus TaxID=1245748 RepID=A0A229YXD9_9EURO|nr:hypothetical protein CDV55_108767 [Aspergillus turcosus]RLL97540.1 hypothetical protein CFD26_106561 [Aspergillus turcosus]
MTFFVPHDRNESTTWILLACFSSKRSESDLEECPSHERASPSGRAVRSEATKYQCYHSENIWKEKEQQSMLGGMDASAFTIHTINELPKKPA